MVFKSGYKEKISSFSSFVKKKLFIWHGQARVKLAKEKKKMV